MKILINGVLVGVVNLETVELLRQKLPDANIRVVDMTSAGWKD